MTWRQYAADVRRVAAGLAGLGIGRGDTVSLMMANRIEFYPLEVGAQHLGATSFSAYNTLPGEQLTYVFGNAGTKVVICEQQDVERIRASGAGLEHIICIDGSPEGTLSLDDLYAAGKDDFDFDSTWRAVQPDDVVTLIYTSGTTGNPKGVEMTHAHLLFEAQALEAVLGVQFGDRATSFCRRRTSPTARWRCTTKRCSEPKSRWSRSSRDCDGAGRRAPDHLGRRAQGLGKAQAAMNSPSPTSRTRPSARLCNGLCRLPGNVPGTGFRRATFR